MTGRLGTTLLGSIFLLFFTTPATNARTWHIESDGSGDAPTVQAGIDSAQAGDEVLLAPGTYTWTSQVATGTSMIRLKAGVNLRGEGGPNATVLDAEQRGRVLLARDVGIGTEISGLTIANGRPAELNSVGPGIYVAGNSQPTVSNCIIRDNQTLTGDQPDGGGIYCDVALIEDCEFLNNVALASGGAISCGASTIQNCKFIGNRAGHDSGYAGAILCQSASIRDCWFEFNRAGAFIVTLGGAIYEYGVASIERCVFVRNVAQSFSQSSLGGAIAATGGGRIAECIFIDNTVEGPYTNEGGAIYAEDGAVIEACTIVGGSGGNAGGVGGITLHGGGLVTRVILTGVSEGRTCSGAPGPEWRCSNVYGNVNGDQLCGIDGGGNFSLPPLFCSSDPVTSLDVSLDKNSPCAPDQHPGGLDCGLIGAGEVRCGSVAVEPRSWTTLKQLYR